MKRAFKKTLFFASVISLMTFTACEKFLNVSPPFTQDAENYFETPADYEMALIGA